MLDEPRSCRRYQRCCGDLLTLNVHTPRGVSIWPNDAKILFSASELTGVVCRDSARSTMDAQSYAAAAKLLGATPCVLW